LQIQVVIFIYCIRTTCIKFFYFGLLNLILTEFLVGFLS